MYTIDDYTLKGKEFRVIIGNVLCADFLKVMLGQGVIQEVIDNKLVSIEKTLKASSEI